MKYMFLKVGPQSLLCRKMRLPTKRAEGKMKAA